MPTLTHQVTLAALHLSSIDPPHCRNAAWSERRRARLCQVDRREVHARGAAHVHDDGAALVSGGGVHVPDGALALVLHAEVGLLDVRGQQCVHAHLEVLLAHLLLFTMINRAPWPREAAEMSRPISRGQPMAHGRDPNA